MILYFFKKKKIPMISDTCMCSKLSLVLKDFFSENLVQKKSIPNEFCIISILIQNSYKVWNDDETGFLIIRKCD